MITALKAIDARLAKFNRQKSQSTTDGSAPADARTADPLKVKRQDVTIELTIYNLASFAPRRWTNMTLAVADVDQAQQTIIDQAAAMQRFIVERQQSHPRPDEQTAIVRFDVPTAKAEALLLSMRGLGDALQVNTADGASAQDVTETKRGFAITIRSLSTFKAREVQTIQLAAPGSRQATYDMKNAVLAHASRVLLFNFNEQDPSNPIGTVEFEASRDSPTPLSRHWPRMGRSLPVRSIDRPIPTIPLTARFDTA